eukprot:sb/3467370/
MEAGRSGILNSKPSSKRIEMLTSMKSDMLFHARKSEAAMKQRKTDAQRVYVDIARQLHGNAVRCKTNVTELYLADKNYTEIPPLTVYKSLHILWLNNNRIYRVDFLRTNFQVTELYLQNNMITSITGSLKQLKCLNTLFLHVNQLTCVRSCVRELRNMLSLHTLNLFGNPISQEENYREFVIHHLPSVTLLDRQTVSRGERTTAERLFRPYVVGIRDSIKFGRREVFMEDQRQEEGEVKGPTKVRFVEVTKHPHSHPLVSKPRRTPPPMSYSYFDWCTTGEEFLWSKQRSPPTRLTFTV